MWKIKQATWASAALLLPCLFQEITDASLSTRQAADPLPGTLLQRRLPNKACKISRAHKSQCYCFGRTKCQGRECDSNSRPNLWNTPNEWKTLVYFETPTAFRFTFWCNTHKPLFICRLSTCLSFAEHNFSNVFRQTRKEFRHCPARSCTQCAGWSG